MRLSPLFFEWPNLTSSPPQAARIPMESDFSPISSVGSSHNRPTSVEDNEEALRPGLVRMAGLGRG